MDTVNHLKLRVERTQAPTILRALLSAIFFHRILDNVDPETADILETHVAVPSSQSVAASAREREIAARVDEFREVFVEGGMEGGEIAVVFLQRKNKKGWFAVTEALVPWEEHLITITFVTRAAVNPLPAALLQILTFCAEHKDNVPPLIGTSDQTNLSYQILVSPPPSSELFSPSPPLGPMRLTSPPPPPATTPATVLGDVSASKSRRASQNYPHPTSRNVSRSASRTTSPTPRTLPRGPLGAGAARSASPMAAISDAGTSAMGYLGQAKEGLLAVGAKAAGAAGVGWGRGTGK